MSLNQNCSCPMCINSLNKKSVPPPMSPIPIGYPTAFAISPLNIYPAKNEEIFKCQCPVFNCNNTKICNWHHYGCPPSSQLYVSDLGIIRCTFCGMKEEFFNIKFDCGYHEGETESARFKFPTNLKRVLAVVGALEDDQIYSPDFVDSLANALREQYKKKFNIRKK